MRVVIADDAVLFREGLARVLEGAGVAVAAQAGDGEQLLALVRQLGRFRFPSPV
jgi:DNA-binding NarL/FixJ family response regulator